MLVTLEDAAEMLALQPAEIRELVAKGAMPAPMLIAGQMRFDVRRLEHWIAVGAPALSGLGEFPNVPHVGAIPPVPAPRMG